MDMLRDINRQCSNMKESFLREPLNEGFVKMLDPVIERTAPYIQ